VFDLDLILLEFSNSGLSFWGPFLLLLLCGLGLPLPEDIVLVAAGVLAAEDSRPVFPIMVLMYTGILLGDFITFCLGKYLGSRALRSKWGQVFIRPEKLKRAEDLFHKHGVWVIFVGRFLPGLRAPLFFSAGLLGFSRLKFLSIDGFAALISAPLFVWLGHWAWTHYSDDISRLEQTMGKTQMYFVAAVIILVVIALSWYRLKTKEKRTPL